MKNILLLGVLTCFLVSCKTDQKKDINQSDAKKEVISQKFQDLNSLPGDLMLRLFNEATYIDYIFHNLPFSISQDDKPSITSNLKLISPERLGPIPTTCKPMGREFFHIGGEIVAEADVYFQNGCYGYVFLENEKPIYANKVSEAGAKFYSNIITKAQQIKNNAINGQ